MDKLLMIWDSSFWSTKSKWKTHGNLFVVFVIKMKKSGLENKFGCYEW